MVGQIGKQAKAGLENLADQLRRDQGEQIRFGLEQDIRKEMSLAAQTGQLDVRLRPLHEAFQNYGGGGQSQKVNRALLGILQEHVILKAKKLPVYTDLANQLGDAVDVLMKGGGTDPLERLLREKIFAGVADDARINIDQIQLNAATANADEVAKLQGWLDTTIGKTRTSFSISEFVTAAQQVAKSAIASGTNVGTTEGNWRRRMEQEQTKARAIQDLAYGVDINSAARAGYSDATYTQAAGTQHVFNQIKDALGKLDRRAMGPLALGAGLSMVAMGLVGDSYSSEPIIMPGEYVGPRVKDAVASGNLFSYKPVGPTPEQLQHRAVDRAMMDRPINMGTTYVPRPSGYSVRGDLPSGAGLSATQQYLSLLGNSYMSGSIRINDTRRHITASYVDRLMGEY